MTTIKSQRTLRAVLRGYTWGGFEGELVLPPIEVRSVTDIVSALRRYGGDFESAKFSRASVVEISRTRYQKYGYTKRVRFVALHTLSALRDSIADEQSDVRFARDEEEEEEDD